MTSEVEVNRIGQIDSILTILLPGHYAELSSFSF
jgi:hypothetical protein